MSSEATFYANETVTADQLNQIAIDLGFTAYSKFPENPPQSAVAALNQITSDLVGSGVINIGGKLAVTQDDNNLYVATGVAVFADGAKIRITSPETISKSAYTSGTFYLYLYNNKVENKAQLIFSQAVPTGDYAMLAEYSSGTITDRRQPCGAKVALNANNTVEVFNGLKIEASQNGTPVPLGNVNLRPSMLFYNSGELTNAVYDFNSGIYKSITYLNGSHTMADRIYYIYGYSIIASFQVTKDTLGNVSLIPSWNNEKYGNSVSIGGTIYLV